jgi:hypothetical protein
MEYKFLKKWDIPNDLPQHLIESRRALNGIIQDYNDWQIDWDFDMDMTRKLLARLEWFGQVYDESGDLLLEDAHVMKSFIIRKIEKFNDQTDWDEFR